MSLQCRLCDDGDNYTSVDEFYDHAVAVHLPKPSPVSLPIVTVKDAIMGEEVKKRRLTRRKSAAGERGVVPPSGDAEAGGRGGGVVPVGSKKKPVAFCKNITQLMGIIIKQCLRTEQDTRSLSGTHFDTIIMATENDVVKSMREQTWL